MNSTQEHSRVSFRTPRLYLLGFVLLCLPNSPAAQVLNNVSGTIDVAGVRTVRETPLAAIDTTGGITSSPIDTVESTSIDQEYNINWQKYFTPYLVARSSFRYFRLGVDDDNNGSTWRREYQPSGDIALNNPDFSLGFGARRRVTETNFEQSDLNRDNVNAYIKSRNLRYPLMTLRYDWNRSYDPGDNSRQDVRDKRLQFTGDWNHKIHSFTYNFVRRETDNIPGDVEVTEYSHLLRWGVLTRMLSDKLRFASTYAFSARSQTERVGDSSTVFDPLTISRALYSVDLTPELDSLVESPGLADGDLITPVQPVINIGTLFRDRNIGADLSIPVVAGAIYIYTDRLSDPSVSWSVYTSDDNFTWDLHDVNPSSTYDLVFNRYEITFPSVATRYIKVVNTGVNSEENVFVTELEVLTTPSSGKERETDYRSHIIDLDARYTWSDRLMTSADLSYRNQPAGAADTDNEELSAGASARYRIRPTVTSISRAQTSVQRVGTREDNSTSYTLAQTFLYAPYRSLDFSLSFFHDENHIGSAKFQENNNALIQNRLYLLTTLTMATEAGFSRNNQFAINTRFDTWNGSLSFNGDLFANLDFITSYRYQRTSVVDSTVIRETNSYGLTLNYRATRSIFLRARLDIQDSDNDVFDHEYTATWNVSPRLSVSALMDLNEREYEETASTRRYNINANYKIRSRGNLYFSYVYTEFDEIEDVTTSSLQLGFKTGF